MKKIILLFLFAGILNNASAFTAEVEKDIDDIVNSCLTAAKEDGVTEADMDAYVADCIDAKRAEAGATISYAKD